MRYAKKKRIMRWLAMVLVLCVLFGTGTVPAYQVTAFAAEQEADAADVEAKEGIPEDTGVPAQEDDNDEEVGDETVDESLPETLENTVSGGDMLPLEIPVNTDVPNDVQETEPVSDENVPVETTPGEVPGEAPAEAPADITDVTYEDVSGENTDADVPEDADDESAGTPVEEIVNPDVVEVPEEVLQLRALLDQMESFDLTDETQEAYAALGMQAAASLEVIMELCDSYPGMDEDMARFQALSNRATGGADMLLMVQGEAFTVEIVKVVNGKETERKTVMSTCLQSSNHSGYVHSTNLRKLAIMSGFSGYVGWNWSPYGSSVPSSYTKGLPPSNNYASINYNASTGSEPYRSNQTLFLFFEEEGTTYSLKYNANGGTGAPASQSEFSTADSHVFIVSDKVPVHTSRFVFEGWATFANASVCEYKAGEEIVVTEPVTTLYAVWRELPSDVTLTYMDRGEQYGPVETYLKGTKVVIKDCTVDRPGYEFIGWNVRPDSNEADWMPVVDTMQLNADTILHAVWREKKGGDNDPQILDFTKTRLTEVPSEIGLTDINTDECVWLEGRNQIANMQTDGQATLLYSLVVTGTPGASYSMIDDDAVWVYGDPMSGTISDSGQVIVYVTRTFTTDDIQDNKLVNTAYCNNIESTVETPVIGYQSVSYYLAKNFRTMNDGILDIPSDFYIEVESLFGDTVASEYLRLEDAVIDESTQTIKWHFFLKTQLNDTTSLRFIEHNYEIPDYEWVKLKIGWPNKDWVGWSDTISNLTFQVGSSSYSFVNTNLYESTHTCVFTVVTEPDCIHPGKEACSCGTEREIPPLGHDFTGVSWSDNHEGGHDETCVSTDHVRVCKRCDGTLKDGQESQSEDHVFSEWERETEPTCTKPGMERRVCTECGHDETREVDPLGHDFEGVPWVDDNAAGQHDDDCDSTEHTRDCKRCHGAEDGGTERAEHPYGDWYVVTEPTCVKPGLEKRDCQVCDHTESRPIEMLGHDLVKDPGEDPDCIHEGLTEGIHCSRCDYVEVEQTVIPALGHDFTDVAWTDNNENGRHDESCVSKDHTRVCGRCGGSLEDGEEQQFAEHIYGEWIVVKEATCEEDGLRERYCNDCDHMEQEPIPAHEHVMVTDEGREPDCIHEGLTGGTHCDICGYIETEQKVIPALGHDFDEVAWLDNHEGGHTDDCESTDHVRVCKRCNGTLVDGKESQAADHVFGDWKTVKEPTVDAEGLRERICIDCGHKESEPIPMTVPEKPEETPKPTPEPDETSEPTPVPEMTPTPEPSPEPTPVPTPVPTPAPTETPEPVIPEESIPEEIPEDIPEEVPETTPEPTPVPTAVPTEVPQEPAPTEEPDMELEPDAEEPVISEVKAEPESDVIGDEPVPLGMRDGNGKAWALVNFFLMNMAVFESAMLLIGYFVQVKKAKKKKDENGNTVSEKESRRKLEKHGDVRILSIVVAIVSIVAFVLTEDITLPTTYVDKWTFMMFIIAAVQTIVVILSRKEEWPAYRVVFVNGEGGQVTAEPYEYVAPGEKVFVSVTAEPAYQFQMLDVLKGEVELRDMQFEMPESDVVIRGVFTKQ